MFAAENVSIYIVLTAVLSECHVPNIKNYILLFLDNNFFI